MSQPVIYFLREGLLQSVASDVVTFSMLVGSVWFNNAFVGGSYFLNAIILVMFMFFLLAKTSGKKVFYSRNELIKHLQLEEAA
jgi:hypothetical protein